MIRPVPMLAALLLAPALAQAQTADRWKLDFEHEKPQILTLRSDRDSVENYWYFMYTLSNRTDVVVPLLVDLMLYTETGKDLQHDSNKVDPEPTKTVLEHPRRNESLKFGRFFSDVAVARHAEYRIIETHAKLGARSPGLVEESIEELKKGFLVDPEAPDVKGRWKAGDRLYLNAREMRMQRFIKPGQKLHGVAIFRNVDPRARTLEIHASGLWDVVRVDGYEPDQQKLHYENRVLKVVYDFKGDEYDREMDVLVQSRREWVVKAIGPIASKETLGTLVDMLITQLRHEERWASGDVKPEDVDVERKREQLTPLDFNIAARVVAMATGKDFAWSAEKTLMENRAAVWRIHEWWTTNRSSLAFNEATGRFEVRNEPLPGTQK